MRFEDSAFLIEGVAFGPTLMRLNNYQAGSAIRLAVFLQGCSFGRELPIDVFPMDTGLTNTPTSIRP